MTMRHQLLGTLLLTVLFSGCTDQTSSTITEPLRPLWLVHAEQAQQTVSIDGRVAEQGSPATTLRNDVEKLVRGQSLETWLGGRATAERVDRDLGIRLVAGDLMQAVDARGSYPLRRREKLFNYRVSIPHDASLDELELRLDYAEQRFEPSITAVRLIELTNFALVESEVVLSTSDNINLSWNIGAINPTASTTLLQRIQLVRESCDAAVSGDTISVVSVVSDTRSITVPTSELPAPESGSSAADFSGTCLYSVQLMVGVIPSFLLADDAEGDSVGNSANPSSDPIVVLLSLSAKPMVQVSYAN